MKILYVISSLHGTPGGHIFSFEHTVTTMSDVVDVVIVNLGVENPIISKLPFQSYVIPINVVHGKNIIDVYKRETPDVIHCFDATSFNYVSSMLLYKRPSIVLTIPGGNPNPKHIPVCSDVILYSKETMDSFGNSKRFKNSKLHYIPNRVNPTLLRRENVKNDKFTFLQVIRINERKHLQILKTLQFARYLSERKIPARVVLAGTVNHKREEDFIKQYINDYNISDYVKLITDDRVNRGSDLLCFGDCIIATGRSVMEAASLGKIILVPAKHLDYPVLLDSETFRSLFDFNFSGRTEEIFSRNLIKIDKIFYDEKYTTALREYLFKISNDYFIINNNVKENYLRIYRSAQSCNLYNMIRLNLQVLLRFYAIILYNFIRFFIKKYK